MNIKLLDCTLRDGGYVNNWNFGEEKIKNIITKLISANIDVIEIGFLDKRVEKNLDKTISPDMLNFNKLLSNINKNETKIYAMIDYGTFDLEKIIPKNESIIDGIRVIFTQDKIEDALEFCKEIKKKGYIVFANAVNITNYKEEDFIRLYNSVNTSKIDGVSIVDTYGVLDPDEALELYKKFDKNIDKSLAIGFHAHNTLQFATANCYKIIRNINPNRITYIDGTLCGMGKGSGNAYTEVLIRILNKYGYGYEICQVLDLIQNEINDLMQQYPKDYQLCRFLSSINNVYYKYTDYYMNIKKLELQEILLIESYIENEDKFNFSQEKADKYLELYHKKLKYNAVIFDVDGTLLDTTSGILSAIDYTIKKCNLNDLDYDNKLYFIGPPIQDSFKKAYSLTEDDALKVAKVFRDRYKTKDLYKANLYNGIIELLKDLKAHGIKIGVATYKREDYALDLMKYFGVSQYCDSIHGSDYDGKLSKYDIIRIVIEELGINDKNRTVMIGDCETDYEGAKKNNIDFIGVTYGFGYTGDEPNIKLVKNVDGLKSHLL